MTFNPSAGGGGLSGLTSGFLLKATSGTTAGNSIVSESGTVVTIAGTLSIGTGTLATSGAIRLASGDAIRWRNSVNSANVSIAYSNSDSRLEVGFGVPVFLDHDLMWLTDGTWSIGTSAGTRPRRLFLTDYVTVGNNTSTTGCLNTANSAVAVAARNQANNADIELIRSDNTNRLVLRGYAAFPSSDGTSGQALTTNGSGVLSWSTVAASAPFVKASGVLTDVAVNNAAYQTLATASVTGIAAGDQVEIDVWGTYLNNSGATVTPDYQASFGGSVIDLKDGTTIAFSATNRASFRLTARFSVATAGSVGGLFQLDRNTPVGANNSGSIAVTTLRRAFQTYAVDRTGTQTITMSCKSSTVTATQTFTVFGYTVRKITAV